MFANLPDCALNHLANLISKSFQNVTFPTCVKIGIIIHLHKGEGKDQASNHRPIAFLVWIIIERLFKERVLPFLLKYKIQSIHQFEIFSDKYTNDAMFSLFKNVHSNVNRQHSTARIFCDFSSAFDCVNYNIVINKLQCYRFRGTPVEWFKLYRNDRISL